MTASDATRGENTAMTVDPGSQDGVQALPRCAPPDGAEKPLAVPPCAAEVVTIKITGETEVETDLGVTRHRTPIFTACRRLLAAGYPADARVEVRRPGGMLSMSGRLGRLAALTVLEEPSLRIVPWKPHPLYGVDRE